MIKNPFAQDNQTGLLNFCFVAFGLLLFLGILVFIYLFSEFFSSIFPEQFLNLFDLTKSGNLFQWFLAAIWLKIAIDARIIFLLSKGIEPQFVKRFLWLLVALFAVILSMSSVCSLISISGNLIWDYFLSFSPDKSVIQMMIRCFRFLLMISVAICVCLFYNSLSCFNYQKKFLYLILTISFLTFGLASSVKNSASSSTQKEVSPNLVADLKPETENKPSLEISQKDHLTSIPVLNVSDSKEVKESTLEILDDSKKTDHSTQNPQTNKPAESELSGKPEQLANSFLNSQDFSAANQKETKESQSDNVSIFVSIESQSDKKQGKDIRFEELLGWQLSLEENLNLSKQIEAYCGLQGSVESRIIPQEYYFDVLRCNVSLYYGFYGFAVILFYFVIFMILRSVRMSHKFLKNEFNHNAAVLSLMENEKKFFKL
ncbi:MAG: hypothetical protein Q4C95_07310 [Planctomycetia bacterium]|nr:hypothetical protein [Planctomycetia bacterium]